MQKPKSERAADARPVSAEVPAAARGTNEPGAYLDANVYTLCIQDVEDP